MDCHYEMLWSHEIKDGGAEHEGRGIIVGVSHVLDVRVYSPSVSSIAGCRALGPSLRERNNGIRPIIRPVLPPKRADLTVGNC